jgi:hypothetical protein
MSANYLFQTEHPQLNYVLFFEIMRDFRKGGLNPNNYEEFISLVKKLPPMPTRDEIDYKVFDHLNLTDIYEDDFSVVLREIFKRGVENSKKCWHPDAGIHTCKLDKSGKILVSAAHSIQNNGVLSKISKDGHVTTYSRDSAGFGGKEVGKGHASIFWGFCNTHDSMFKPIESGEYSGTQEQNFLYAYRAFVVASHKKLEASSYIDFGEQATNDINATKEIFDHAIINKNYEIIETHPIELPLPYPIAVSTSFYLDFDFKGNTIPHSDDRMETVFITIFPDNGKTYLLLSYLTQDKQLYGNLSEQLKSRDKLKSDITVLLAAHVENIYFEPVYFKTFIEKQAHQIELIFKQAQFDVQRLDFEGNHFDSVSLTPPDYLDNKFELNFFGY